MAGTPFRSVVTGGVQRTKQRPRGVVGLLDRSLASGTWARSSGQRVPSRMPALAGQPNVSSLQPTGNAGRYTSIPSMPFLRGASVKAGVARLSVLRRRILSNGPIFETLLRPSLLKSVTTLTSLPDGFTP